MTTAISPKNTLSDNASGLPSGGVVSARLHENKSEGFCFQAKLSNPFKREMTDRRPRLQLLVLGSLRPGQPAAKLAQSQVSTTGEFGELSLDKPSGPLTLDVHEGAGAGVLLGSVRWSPDAGPAMSLALENRSNKKIAVALAEKKTVLHLRVVEVKAASPVGDIKLATLDAKDLGPLPTFKPAPAVFDGEQRAEDAASDPDRLTCGEQCPWSVLQPVVWWL